MEPLYPYCLPRTDPRGVAGRLGLPADDLPVVAQTSAQSRLSRMHLTGLLHVLLAQAVVGARRARLRAVVAGLDAADQHAPIRIEARGSALLLVGWALVYAPRMPEAFLYASGLDEERQGGLLDGLYLSFVAQTTLGYGDIAPREDWLRRLAPMQALLGFALLTAGVSWVLSIYPALARRRALARQVRGMLEAQRRARGTLGELGPEALARRLEKLTTGMPRYGSTSRSFPPPTTSASRQGRSRSPPSCRTSAASRTPACSRRRGSPRWSCDRPWPSSPPSSAASCSACRGNPPTTSSPRC
jgi:hypothetical protein